MTTSKRIPYRRRALAALVIGVAGGSSLAVAACGDDDAARSAHFPEDDAAIDARSSGDAAPEDDAGDRASEDAAVDAGVFDASDDPVVCEVSPCAVQITGGANSFCARMNDGTVQCWGGDPNRYGVLGRGTPDAGVDAGPGPQRVVELDHVTSLSSSKDGARCAVLEDGGVRCWGPNFVGQLGLSHEAVIDYEGHPTPSPVALDEPARTVELSGMVGCAVGASGATWCWGRKVGAPFRSLRRTEQRRRPGSLRRIHPRPRLRRHRPHQRRQAALVGPDGDAGARRLPR